jgi:hypothetical protein
MTLRSISVIMLLLTALFIGTIASIQAARSLPFAKNFTVTTAAGPYNPTSLAMRCNPPAVVVEGLAFMPTAASR